MADELTFCFECFLSEQINENLEETNKQIAQIQTEQTKSFERAIRNDRRLCHNENSFIEDFAKNFKENETKLVKNRQLIEEEFRQILKRISINLDRISAQPIGIERDDQYRIASNRLRHQHDQFDSEVTQFIHIIDQCSNHNFLDRIQLWIDEHLEYIETIEIVPKDLLIDYANNRVTLWNERSLLIDQLIEQLRIDDEILQNQLSNGLHYRSSNLFHTIEYLRSFMDQYQRQRRSDTETSIRQITTALIEARRAEQQTRTIELADSLRQLTVGSKDGKRFDQRFQQTIDQSNHLVPIVLGRIDQPTEKELPLIFRLDGNFQRWKENRSSIQEDFCTDLCQAWDLPEGTIRIIQVEQGSTIVHSLVQPPHGKQVLDILSADPTKKPSVAKYLDEMKELAVKYESPLTSIKVGDFGVNADDQLMDPQWNRTYTQEPGHLNGTYWRGALNRGGKPYFCPKGWMRFSIKVAKDDAEFDAKWGSWHIAYHGTRSSNAPWILASGLRTSVRGCFALRGRSSVYLTPSIEYAAHPRYARPWQRKGDENYWYQMVFQCRVNPRAVGKTRPQTLIDKEYRDVIVIDKNFSNDELEWIIPAASADVTYIRENIVCYGIMIRISDCDPKELRACSWWKYAAVGEREYDSIEADEQYEKSFKD